VRALHHARETTRHSMFCCPLNSRIHSELKPLLMPFLIPDS
jgi:hypothetical protein